MNIADFLEKSKDFNLYCILINDEVQGYTDNKSKAQFFLKQYCKEIEEKNKYDVIKNDTLENEINLIFIKKGYLYNSEICRYNIKYININKINNVIFNSA